MVLKADGPLFHDDGKEAFAALGCPVKGCKHKFKVVWRESAGPIVSFRKMNYYIMLMLKKHIMANHKNYGKGKGKGPQIIIDEL